MKSENIKIIYLVILCFLTGYSNYAQTTNEGMLYISPGTEFSTEEDLNITSTGEFYNDGEAFIYQSFYNEGIIDFYQQTGLTRFIGQNSQIIGGSQESFLYNVYFFNTSEDNPFYLSGAININGLADFDRGVVDNDNYGGQITFSDEATHVNVSDDSHVDGFVTKLGDTEFIYPIGDGHFYRFAGISAPISTNANFRGKYFYESADPLYPLASKEGILTEIDKNEYWIIEEVSTTSEDVLITLSWREATSPGTIVSAAEAEAITIVRWDDEEALWVNEGGIVDVNNKTVTTSVNKYGVYTLGKISKNDMLPCEITVYNAVTPNGDGDNDYFRIEEYNEGCAENLHVMVFNRWGVKVFETNNYGMSGDVFNGFSDGRLTIDENSQLPTGTYFYILSYNYLDEQSDERQFKKAGYLYLSGN